MTSIPAFLPAKTSDWHTTSLPPLPDWLSISRLINPRDALYYHAALLVTFDTHASSLRDSPLSQTPSDPAAAVIYTPHGIAADAIPDLTSLDPPIKTLALLHGLHSISLSAQQLNLGAHNGLAAQTKVRAKYWIGTHDEVKKGFGLVSWFLNRTVLSVEDAISKRAQEDAVDGEARTAWEGVKCLEVGNGESVVLR